MVDAAQERAKTNYSKQLYPFLDDIENCLPSEWNCQDKHSYITLCNYNLTVQYNGQGKTPHDAASVRANRPIPTQCGIYYFEVKVESKGRDGYMGIGLSANDVSTNRLPGWDKKSYGYHGDDGNSFCCSGQGQSYGPTFTTGDVIGCCINMIEKICFFTKNGINLGVAFKDLPNGLYPTVGLQTPGESVVTNFGQEPFVFDIEDYMKEYRMVIRESIDSVKLVPSKEHWQSLLHRIISSYLVHYGYSNTAESFARDTGQSLEEEIASIQNRHRIQKLILSGKVGEAIALTKDLYPGLLESKPDLLFRLKCRQLVEMISGGDTVDTHLRSPARLSTRSSPSTSPHSYSRSLHSSRSSSPYRPAAAVIGSPQSVHSNGASSSSESSNGVINGDALLPLELNGNGHAASDVIAEEVDESANSMEVDMPSKTHRLKTGNESFILKTLEFGKDLNLMHKKLKEAGSANQMSDRLLQDVFSLLAYADPWDSPSVVRTQLDPIQREPICSELNSAILESLGLSQVPALESIVGQTNKTLQQMGQVGLAESAFAQLSDIVPLCKRPKAQ